MKLRNVINTFSLFHLYGLNAQRKSNTVDVILTTVILINPVISFQWI